ncbi:Hg(II)-responsive transcriptional regulator [Marinobacterium aestuariivivens]|uniref:Mercuric resistance operon regulatory protein n=1 Tax=Marinobacterium aestuariivivens TaxID=1698799 RepID=A0ABW2A7U6_9GAMM
MVTELTIGKLAEAAGVNIETIRYYQRRGLLEEPPKPLGGHRRYASEQVRHVRFIKRAQALGFTLEEVGTLMRLDPNCACAETQELAERKLELIEHKMADLAAIRQALSGLVKQCESGGDGADCPIIDVLTGERCPDE